MPSSGVGAARHGKDREMPSDSIHSDPWTIEPSSGPIVACAIHGGHDLRPEIARRMLLSDAGRRREEDPYTGDWTSIGDSRVTVHRSRFEVDLNRERDCAVYLEPSDCWDLSVRSESLPEPEIEKSRFLHDRFYEDLYDLLDQTRTRWGRFVLLDLHTYNHRRDGAHSPPADPEQNPDINVGTGSVDRQTWGPLIDRIVADLGKFSVNGAPLQVGENVKFKGAHLVRWVNSTFPHSCALALEVKKIFMDEITGELDHRAWTEIHRALQAAETACRDELDR